MNYGIQDLILEITRRCQMKCEHCVRGGAQRIDMSNEIIRKSILSFNQIGVLTFTGGEPMLNVRGMIEALQIIRYNRISLNGFYIVTNGKVFSEELMDELMYIYDNVAMDKGLCGLAVSRDQYHDLFTTERVQNNIYRYMDYPFFWNEDKNMYKYSKSGIASSKIIPDGRGKNIGYGEPVTKEDVKKCDRRVELTWEGVDYKNYNGDLYINALGDIIPCANCSYVTQKKIKSGRFDKIHEYLDQCPRSKDYYGD